VRNNCDYGYSKLSYEHKEIGFFQRTKMEQFYTSYADTYGYEIIENPVLK